MKRGQMEEEETKLASLFPTPSSSDSAILKDIQATQKLHTRAFWEESKPIPKADYYQPTAPHFPAKEGSTTTFTPDNSFLESDDDVKAKKDEIISNPSSEVSMPTSSHSTPRSNIVSPFATASQATDR